MNFFFDDLESFRGSDGGGGEKMSEQAYEKFQEQMRATARELKALQKSEQKKKKKEDRLAQILGDFFKKKAKSGIVFAAAKLLAENIPPMFVLAVMILIDRESLDDARKTIYEEGARLERMALSEEELELIPEANGTITDWMNVMAEFAGREPIRFLSTVKNPEKKLKFIVVNFAAQVLKDYFDEKNMDIEKELLDQFSISILRRIVDQVQQNTEQLEVLHEQDLSGSLNEPLS